MKKIFTILGISAAFFMNAQIVINEVYGGGGNSGATLRNDFVELINRGTVPVTISGATLQYASASGTFNTYQTLPNITLQPNQTYLIQEAAGTGGTTNLPTPDFVGTTLINFDGSANTSTSGFAMAGTNLKMVLASNATQVTSPTDANVLDFVGTGTANQFEGTGAAPVMTNTTSDSRTNGIDTNNNAADFTNGTPTPKNSSGTTLGVPDISGAQLNFVRNTLVNNEISFGAKSAVSVYNMNGQVVKTASVEKGSTLNVSSLPKGIYIVTGNVDGKSVSQKITKN